jgi:hypothetical protein
MYDYTLKIEQDEWTESPRSAFDCLGTFSCFHHRTQKCGDDQSLTSESLEELEKRKDVVSLPVYMYDHSGVSFSTTPFSCRWDSGRIGVIYVEREKILKVYGIKKVSKKLREKIENNLKNEIKAYSQWVNGEVFMYTIEDKEGEVESLGGIYYDGDAIIKDAISLIKNREPMGLFPREVRVEVKHCFSSTPSVITIDIPGYSDKSDKAA